MNRQNSGALLGILEILVLEHQAVKAYENHAEKAS
jgi:hypothetical protein